VRNWSAPAPIDWMKCSPLRAQQELRESPEITSTSDLAYPLLKRGAVAHLEALDAGRERQETLAQAIGNTRKTDGQLVLGREHGDTSQFVGYADGARQRAECWLAASTRIVRVGTHLATSSRRATIRYPVAVGGITDVARPHGFGRKMG
jgi:hypothetical protein